MIQNIKAMQKTDQSDYIEIENFCTDKNKHTKAKQNNKSQTGQQQLQLILQIKDKYA